MSSAPTDERTEILAEEMNRIRGRLLGMVEAVGFPDVQERGIKQLLKSLTYDAQARVAELMEADPFPYGECHCGCGQDTQPYASTRTAKGQTRGEPQKYLKGHHHAPEIGYELSPITGCWNWTKAKCQYGYGRLGINGTHWLAHRYMYTINKGDIEPGMELHHTCYNPSCVNPQHLEPVTSEEHTRLTRERYKDETLRKVGDLAHEGLAALEAGDYTRVEAVLTSLTYDSQARILELIEEDPA